MEPFIKFALRQLEPEFIPRTAILCGIAYEYTQSLRNRVYDWYYRKPLRVL